MYSVCVGQPYSSVTRKPASVKVVRPQAVRPIQFGADQFTASKPVRFLLVEDTQHVIEGMIEGVELHHPKLKAKVAEKLGVQPEHLPPYEICGVAKTYEDAVKSFRQTKPDFVLLDWDLADTMYFPEYEMDINPFATGPVREEIKSGNDLRQALLQSGFPKERIIWISSRPPSPEFGDSPNLSKKWWPHPNGVDWVSVMGNVWEEPEYIQRLQKAVQAGLNVPVAESSYQLSQGTISPKDKRLKEKRWLYWFETVKDKVRGRKKLIAQHQAQWPIDVQLLREQVIGNIATRGY